MSAPMAHNQLVTEGSATSLPSTAESFDPLASLMAPPSRSLPRASSLGTFSQPSPLAPPTIGIFGAPKIQHVAVGASADVSINAKNTNASDAGSFPPPIANNGITGNVPVNLGAPPTF
jgi:hypothetical protein